MTTYYCPNMEEALHRAKKVWREPGCYFGGITLRSGRRDLLCIVTGRWWRNIQQWDGGYDCICFRVQMNPGFTRIHLPIAVE